MIIETSQNSQENTCARVSFFHACCKIEMSDKTSLHILCLYSSPNSSSENNKVLGKLILNTSLIGGKLLILGDFNFPTINWDNLSTPHLPNHCTSEFLAATQDAFLFQYDQSPAHTRPNQKPTLIDLFFSQDDQTTYIWSSCLY